MCAVRFAASLAFLNSPSEFAIRQLNALFAEFAITEFAIRQLNALFGGEFSARPATICSMAQLQRVVAVENSPENSPSGSCEKFSAWNPNNSDRNCSDCGIMGL
jgi:hypothetical protein